MSTCNTDSLFVGTYQIYVNGHDLGTTSGGVSITQNNEFTEIYNDQTNVLQGIFRTKQDFVVTVNVRELTLDKMRAFSGTKEGLNAAGDVLCISSDFGCTFPEEFDLTIEGPGPGCMCRTFHFPRVVFTPSSLEYIMNREEVTELSVEFRVLAGCNGGILGCITDRCATPGTDYIISTDENTSETVLVDTDPIPNYVPGM